MRDGPAAVPGVTTTSTSSKIDWIRVFNPASAARTAAIRRSEKNEPRRAMLRVRGSSRSG